MENNCKDLPYVSSDILLKKCSFTIKRSPGTTEVSVNLPIGLGYTRYSKL
ncbi:hypothetical protein [Paenibacillus plantarum]|nr:hypothetical protein [Paenibacillus plantarum]